jgi:hypothetical protein
MSQPAATLEPESSQRIEQRRDVRLAAGGEIRFRLDDRGSDVPARDVEGRLLDRSAGGFRAEHDCRELGCGQIVRYRSKASGKGRARVVWTRILGDRVESGFLILP